MENNYEHYFYKIEGSPPIRKVVVHVYDPPHKDKRLHYFAVSFPDLMQIRRKAMRMDIRRMRSQ